MRDRGLLPVFSEAALQQVRTLQAAADGGSGSQGAEIRDLRALPWSSIDNDSSRDLDQLTVAEALPGDVVRVRVAVADVDALVTRGSALDEHARHNTTSVYTAAAIFPMLPERLSTDLTSLNPDVDRLAVVVEMDVDRDGAVRPLRCLPGRGPQPRQARLQRRGGLAGGPADPCRAPLAAIAGLADNLRLQDQVAQRLRAAPARHGALSLDTIRARPVFDGDDLRDLDVDRKNRATELIEDFMIAANGVTARFLAGEALSDDPPRGAVAETLGSDRRARSRRTAPSCPREPDSAALDAFLVKAQGRRSRALPRPVARGRSSCSAPASTWPSGRARRRPGTSGWPSRTTRIPRRRTGATPTWSPSGC